MEEVLLHIEAILFASQQAVTISDFQKCLEQVLDRKVSAVGIEDYLDQLMARYQKGSYAFSLVKISGGYQFLTKSKFHKTVAIYLNHKAKKKLSTAAMETLSIIAYKQPISKAAIEQIRGVNCDYSIRKLLDKSLVKIKGRSEAPGRPLLYATSDLFMDYFGLHSASDLPQLKDIRPASNEIGQPES